MNERMGFFDPTPPLGVGFAPPVTGALRTRALADLTAVSDGSAHL